MTRTTTQIVVRLDGTWVTSAEAAGMMGCSLDYVHRLNALGALKPYRVGRVCLYRKREIEKYIESHPRLGKRTA